MKYTILAALLSFPAIAHAADPWEGKEVGADSQSATIQCGRWLTSTTVRASEITISSGAYRVVLNDQNAVVLVPVSDCRVTIGPARPLAETNRR